MLRIFLLFAAAALCGHEIDSYLKREYLGDYRKEEIEIVKDPDQVAAIEEMQYRRLIKKGLSEETAKEWARTGIVAEDFYWIWQRDPVLFPGGGTGAYGRILWKSQLSGPVGVAVLPILGGKIALNLTFRHATRSWEWELPRGVRNEGEAAEEAAFRELKEETGLSAASLVFLGDMAADSGVLGSIVPIYAGWTEERGGEEREESEAIAGIHTFTIEELEEGLRQGYIEIEPQGKVPLRDSFLTYALFQFKNRHFNLENKAMLERPKVGIGVLVLKDDCILMGKRRSSHGEGAWAPPGGHLEFGETAEICAARELLEETGLKAVSIRRGPWTNDVIDGAKHYITLFMIVDQFEGNLENKEPHKCDKWEWHRWDNLPQGLFEPMVSLQKLNFNP